MTAWLATMAPIVLSVLLGGTARRLVGVLPPATAVRLLAVGGFVTALSLGFVLSLLALPLIAQQSEVAELGHWSIGAVRALDPVPAAVAATAAAIVVGLLCAAVARAWRAGRDLWLADTTCRRLRGDAGRLVVVDDDRPDAYAVAGMRGRVVVSTAMLRALAPAERRVVLAHEAAHLRHRHHVYVLLADLAAAADPALRPLAAAVRRGIERWADEDAAREVGDRTLTARAIARAAVARAAVTRAGAVPRATTRLAVADHAVAERARALLRPSPRPRRVIAAGLGLAITATVASAGLAGHVTESRFERAQAATAAIATR
jgi:Zn-dependent protease with chaperone function